MDKIVNNIYNIFLKENKFLTLPELYMIYKNTYDTSNYMDYTAVIRRHIYSHCLDRDLRDNRKKAVFYSLAPKKTRGNLYGITEWISNTENTDVNISEINELIDKLPSKPIFDEVPILKYEQIKHYSVLRLTSRKVRYAVNAIVEANYLCEVDVNHETFIRKTNDKPYSEAHHLIPLKFQKYFEYPLDVPANIISLCSNCHNKIHYGADIKSLLEKLYLLRQEKLRKYKIDCGFEQLCKFYDI